MNKILIIIAMSFVFLGANTIEVGTPIYKFNGYKYETPQGRNMRVSKRTKVVVIAFEQETGALVNKYLDTQDPYYLLENNVVFIADIHKMPAMVTKMFALPKLQEFKHPIYLSYGEKFPQDMPHKKGQITIVEIQNAKIKNISYISTQKELIEVIE